MKIRSLVCALLLVPALAHAEPKTADEWYKFGENQYNLGNFDEAVDAFKKGFELEPNEKKKTAYLYNIAQSYRQAKDCANALFFYKRFLALRPDLADQVRKDVQDRIKELEECQRQQEALRNKPPTTNLKPGDGTVTDGDGQGPGTGDPDPSKGPDVAVKPGDGDGDGEGDGDGDASTGVTARVTPGTPRLLSVRAIGGGAKVSAGGIDIPVRVTGAVLAGYPLAIAPKLTLEVGAGATFTTLAFDDMAGEGKTASLFGLVANVGGTYEVAPKIGVRGDLGVGALVFSGASGSPFTAFAPTTGSLTMLHLRVGVSADYAITPNVVATVTPVAFSFSPAKEGLQTVDGSKIDAITAIDFMIGVGYRM